MDAGEPADALLPASRSIGMLGAGCSSGSFALSSNDVAMVATAEYVDVPTIVTTDAGFAAVSESRLTIYTNATRVGPCRRLRQRISPGE